MLMLLLSWSLFYCYCQDKRIRDTALQTLILVVILTSNTSSDTSSDTSSNDNNNTIW